MRHEEIEEYLKDNIDRFMEQFTIFEPPFECVPQYYLPNGLKVDLAILDVNKKLCTFIEVKPGFASINEIVRGFGQAFQYHKSLENDIEIAVNNPKTFLVTSVENKIRVDYNSLYKPDEFKIVFLDKVRDVYEEFLDDDLRKQSNWIIISPYYLRDVRFRSLYFLLRFLFKKQAQALLKPIKGLDIESYLRTLPDFPGDKRNHIIVLKGLNFIKTSNILTSKGYKMAMKGFIDFSRELAYNYFAPQITVFYKALEEIAQDKGCPHTNIELEGLRELKEKIVEMHGKKNILYLCDRDGGNRDVGSWMHILKEDLGALNYEKVGTTIKKVVLNYFPLKNLEFKMNHFTNHPLEDINKWFSHESIPFDL